MAVSKATLAKHNREKLDYGLDTNLSYDFAKVYVHHADERHIVVDSRTGEILKRFKAGELAWNNAERFARDYYWEHRNDPDPDEED
jgi:hypothetical protein